MSITTDIIIVSYGDNKDLNRCVESIKKYCRDYELYIRDNNPPNENLGFTKANNIMIERGKAPFVWLLNQDAIVLNEKTQQALIDRFSYGDQVGIVASMQLDYEDRDLISCGGVYCGNGSPFPAGRHRGGRISMGHWQIPEKQTWCNFASAMLRRDMINKIGLLDTSMFLLYSDSDYCFYARSRGYECWYEPRSQVCHRLRTSKNISEWHKRDMEAFMRKWGITLVNGNFHVSEQFHKLDIFP